MKNITKREKCTLALAIAITTISTFTVATYYKNKIDNSIPIVELPVEIKVMIDGKEYKDEVFQHEYQNFFNGAKNSIAYRKVRDNKIEEHDIKLTGEELEKEKENFNRNYGYDHTVDIEYHGDSKLLDKEIEQNGKFAKILVEENKDKDFTVTEEEIEEFEETTTRNDSREEVISYLKQRKVNEFVELEMKKLMEQITVDFE